MSLMSNVNCNRSSGLGCWVNQNGTAGSTNHDLQRSGPGVYTPSILSALLQSVLLCPFPCFLRSGLGTWVSCLSLNWGVGRKPLLRRKGSTPEQSFLCSGIFSETQSKWKGTGDRKEIKPGWAGPGMLLFPGTRV